MSNRVAVMSKIRIVLLPFSILYGLILAVRNWFFDLGLFSIYRIKTPSIIVGNLSVGGTGKTPHIQYLADYFQSKNTKTHIVSRGYGRVTKGLKVADTSDTAQTIGDEPKFYFDKNPQAQIIVAEERKLACQLIDKEENKAEKQIILLDDAFQHRHVQAGFTIVLSSFHRPFFNDFVLPAGNLREWKKGVKRADVLLVTKCPPSFSGKEKEKYLEKLKSYEVPVFFSSIDYQPLISLFNAALPSQIGGILLVSAIADTHSLLQELKNQYPGIPIEELKYPDHHDFSQVNLLDIRQKFGNFARENYILISTEKDAVKLKNGDELRGIENLPWFIQPIGIKIDKELEFLNRIEQYVSKVSRIS
ncbi:MAG: tetraacyldisaccharide 4'-kinase [Bacteroidetes bacterium]|nr:tetraacyldisaccharide 4'-kinase [Bacteroidota bacterium]